ncbi:MAG: PadR family transcriptional regulator [Alphaproteobacteria bacterium]|nr:PadR family transcriptional regulator [Alphaproteobacteria bacterium]
MDVKTLCLGILTFGDATGYEIKGYFEDGPFSHFFQAGFGSIYPALNKALGEGLVTCRAESQGGRPDKKIYALTPSGRDYLTNDLSKVPADDKIRSEYLVTLFFANFVSSPHLANVYDRYLADFEDNAEKMKNLPGGDIPAGQVFVREFGMNFYQSIGSFLRENRERFIAGVEAGRAPKGDDVPNGSTGRGDAA